MVIPPKHENVFSFNSQPPEGGWTGAGIRISSGRSFNSQPPEGGWLPACRQVICSKKFQLTAARRRLAVLVGLCRCAQPLFQLTAARRRLGIIGQLKHRIIQFQLTAARRRLDGFVHKALGDSGFNSQPPEGGWQPIKPKISTSAQFQLTAARRRLALCSAGALLYSCVSTHSRPKAAGLNGLAIVPIRVVSTHSRPKAAGFVNCCHSDLKSVSTHSRPKAAGVKTVGDVLFFRVSTHSRPKAAGQAPPLG